jgi:hypothetical protein
MTCQSSRLFSVSKLIIWRYDFANKRVFVCCLAKLKSILFICDNAVYDPKNLKVNTYFIVLFTCCCIFDIN